jgi:two-component system OmpR family sensor kinase
MSIDFTEATDAPVRTPPIVLGEENKVRQVVTNLLGNARRFSPADGANEIVVGADRSRGVGTIAVVDHGEGIPPQIREHIFERFWRADTSRARETGGSGLGLAIVASIVESLHGSVRVEETPGGGATFIVSLPLAPAQATPAHLLEETQPLDRLDL